ncbi:MAG: hypothetical protein ABSE59_03715, partial [Opitutaceae bacterium]
MRRPPAQYFIAKRKREGDGGQRSLCKRLRCSAGVVFGWIFFAGGVGAQTSTDLPAAAELKKLSVEELMDIQVTSVSREPEKWLDAPSAIQVVNGDEIDRSGAASIPEALRLADNLEVAQ